jgi:hypothetical protein
MEAGSSDLGTADVAQVCENSDTFCAIRHTCRIWESCCEPLSNRGCGINTRDAQGSDLSDSPTGSSLARHAGHGRFRGCRITRRSSVQRCRTCASTNSHCSLTDTSKISRAWCPISRISSGREAKSSAGRARSRGPAYSAPSRRTAFPPENNEVFMVPPRPVAEGGCYPKCYQKSVIHRKNSSAVECRQR